VSRKGEAYFGYLSDGPFDHVSRGKSEVEGGGCSLFVLPGERGGRGVRKERKITVGRSSLLIPQSKLEALQVDQKSSLVEEGEYIKEGGVTSKEKAENGRKGGKSSQTWPPVGKYASWLWKSEGGGGFFEGKRIYRT